MPKFFKPFHWENWQRPNCGTHSENPKLENWVKETAEFEMFQIDCFLVLEDCENDDKQKEQVGTAIAEAMRRLKVANCNCNQLNNSAQHLVLLSYSPCFHKISFSFSSDFRYQNIINYITETEIFKSSFKKIYIYINSSQWFTKQLSRPSPVMNIHPDHP